MKLKSVIRDVYNARLGKWQKSEYPLTQEEARIENVSKYHPVGFEEVCPICHNIGFRWTVTGQCHVCAKRDAEDTYERAVSINGEPTTPDERAHKLGYYWTYKPGKYCGHVGKTSLNGKCWYCEEERRKPSPRQTAVSAGAVWYDPAPDDPCPHGHVAPRRVANGSCRACEQACKPGQQPRTAGNSLRDICPDTIISRDDARTAGFAHYRTGLPCRAGHIGWRYVSTGNCLSCMGR